MSIDFQKLPCANKSLGVIQLNRPQAINSLDLDMCRTMADKVSEWRHDTNIACIFIEGAGTKGFCAGGDVKKVREAIVKSKTAPHEFQYVIDFFVQEYRNDYQLSLVEKPIICWGSGIAMGGGLGVMQGASYRIVTESSVLSMPEISIGLYPDVGAAFFLSQLPLGVGLFLGLTGARFGPHDALDLGLADFYLKKAKRELVLDNLQKLEWADDPGHNHQKVAEVLLSHKHQLHLPSTISKHFPQLASLEKAKTIFEVVEQLEELSQKSAWVAESMEYLKKGSPLSAHIIFQYLTRARSKTRREIFIQDFALSLQFSLRHDFAEGVRALLVEKDQNPKWQYTSLQDVPASEVAAHFEDPFATGQLQGTSPFLEQAPI